METTLDTVGEMGEHRRAEARRVVVGTSRTRQPRTQAIEPSRLQGQKLYSHAAEAAMAIGLAPGRTGRIGPMSNAATVDGTEFWQRERFWDGFSRPQPRTLHRFHRRARRHRALWFQKCSEPSVEVANIQYFHRGARIHRSSSPLIPHTPDEDSTGFHGGAR